MEVEDTVFRPIYEGVLIGNQDDPEDRPAATQNGLRILLAEDNAVCQRITRRVLEKHGFHVSIASNGKIALDLFNRQSFDLVLMDCQMPVLDGFKTTQLIRQIEEQTLQRIPIVALTSLVMPGDKERCIAAGM